MAAAREPPPTARDLDRWTSGLPTTAAGGALLMLGLDAGRLDAWAQAVASAAPDEGVFLDWRGGRIDRDAGDLAELAERVRLPQDVDVDRAARSVPALRVALGDAPGEGAPLDLGRRLLGFPGVASVLVPVERSPGTVRRRAWRWPLRIGVGEDVEKLAGALTGAGGVPARLVDVHDLRIDPGHTDVLVVPGDAGEAVARLATLRPLANAVVLLSADPRPWSDTLVDLARLRARTGAVAVAVPTGGAPARLADVVARLVRAMARGHPFDVAVTAALDRRAVVVGERTGLARATVPVILRDTARTARSQMRARGLPLEALPASLDRLEALAGDDFDRSAGAAADAATVTASVDDSLTAAVDEDETRAPRLLQMTVGPPGRPVDAVTENVLIEGTNEVQVFIGAEELHALHAGAVPDEDLGFDDPTALSARVTVSLVPLLPRGDPVQAEVDVPRVGRSGTARLPLVVPEGRRRVQARVVVTFRNRVLQTAVLSGDVGDVARVRERLVLRMDLGHLDERRGFDAALVLNHDDAGEAAAIVVADGDVTVEPMPEIDATTARVRTLLIGAATIRGTGAAAAEQTRKLLVEVALKGNELYVPLKPLLDRLDRDGPARRIQVLAARPGRFLPLELVYDRPAPAEDAAVCPQWLAGDDCGPACFADDDDVSIVCPAVFWGLGRVVERHHASLTDPSGTSFVLRAEPRRRRSRLPVDSALVGASAKVRTPEVQKVLDGLGESGSAVQAWDEWKSALADRPRDLLVLMPHTDPARRRWRSTTAGWPLGRVEARHVTGGARRPPPGRAVRLRHRRFGGRPGRLRDTVHGAPGAASSSRR